MRKIVAVQMTTTIVIAIAGIHAIDFVRLSWRTQYAQPLSVLTIRPLFASAIVASPCDGCELNFYSQKQSEYFLGDRFNIVDNGFELARIGSLHEKVNFETVCRHL